MGTLAEIVGRLGLLAPNRVPLGALFSLLMDDCPRLLVLTVKQCSDLMVESGFFIFRPD